MRKLSFSKLLPKGSVLVFSLLILSIMLVTSLTILSSALLNQKASLSTGSSGRSFQVADSGVERVLYQIYKQSNATLEDLGDVIAGGSTATVRCNNGVVSFPVSGGDVKVGFYQDDPSNPGNVISYTNCAGTDWRDKVVKIKSEGTAGTTSRAVEVAVAAAGDYMISCDDIFSPGYSCCRINTKNGDTECKWLNSGTWTSFAYKPWDAGASGSYSISCSNLGNVLCCRIDTSTGNTSCKLGDKLIPWSSYGSGNPW